MSQEDGLPRPASLPERRQPGAHRIPLVSGYVADSDLGHRPAGTRGERRQLPLERQRQASRLCACYTGSRPDVLLKSRLGELRDHEPGRVP